MSNASSASDGFSNLIIEPLSSAHDRTGFTSGAESLDRYIRKQASQDIKRRISRVFVATRTDDREKILGYYTLSAISMNLPQLPERVARKLPKHPIPAALVGRLAVLTAAQGQGIGKMLLADAIKRTLSVSDHIGIYAMAVDAIDDSAKGFYQRFGFTVLSDERQRLFLPLKSIDADGRG